MNSPSDKQHQELPSNGCIALNYGKLKAALIELLRLYDWRNELGRIERDFNHNRKQMTTWLNQYGREKKVAWDVARSTLDGAPDIDTLMLHERIQREAQARASTPSHVATSETRSKRQELTRADLAQQLRSICRLELGRGSVTAIQCLQDASDFLVADVQALEWAASWIENTAAHNTDPAVKEFAANAATAIRQSYARSTKRVA